MFKLITLFDKMVDIDTVTLFNFLIRWLILVQWFHYITLCGLMIDLLVHFCTLAIDTMVNINTGNMFD